MAIMNLLTKQRQTHRHSEQTYGCMGGRHVGGGGWTKNLGLAECEVLCVEWINNKVLQYSVASYI